MDCMTNVAIVFPTYLVYIESQIIWHISDLISRILVDRAEPYSPVNDLLYITKMQRKGNRTPPPSGNIVSFNNCSHDTYRCNRKSVTCMTTGIEIDFRVGIDQFMHTWLAMASTRVSGTGNSDDIWLSFQKLNIKKRMGEIEYLLL